jgi:2-dehydropantoate 2-reductase
MRVLVMGSGGVGGYYGARLAQHGHDVTFVARGAHLAALQRDGLELRTGGATVRLRPAHAVGAPSEARGPFELVLFTVKTYDTDAAAVALRPVVTAETAVLSLQNGVESVERLSAVLGSGRVLAGTTIMLSSIAAPGVIEQRGPTPRVTLSDLTGEVTPRVRAVAAALEGVGVQVVVATDPQRVLWEKFAAQAAHATITSACQLPIGPIRDTDGARELYRTMLDEAVAVGRAVGAALPLDYRDTVLTTFWSLPADARTSLERDFERGGRVELEQLTGTVVRLGRRHGVPTPAFDALYLVLRARANAFGPG